MPDTNTRPNPEMPMTPEVPDLNIEQSEPTIEQKPEQSSEQVARQTVEHTQTTPVALPVDIQNQVQQTDNDEVKKIETLLSQGMENAFLSMDTATQAQFKIKGEETSKKIASLMHQTKVKVKQVIDLILDWLNIIPRVNKFYIEQESKIKAEAILKMYKK